MATLSLTVELAGFQHGDGVFLRLSEDAVFGQPCVRQYSYCTGQCSCTPNVCIPDGPSWVSTSFHGLTTHIYGRRSPNLPSGHHARLEAGNAAPATLILWTKGLQKVHLFADLLHQIHFPELRIHIKNLEDLHCPPVTQLCPATQPWSICQKAVRLARWLAEQGLA